MKKVLLVILAAVMLSACGQAPWEDSLKDVEGGQVRDPDYFQLFNNADLHPNIVLLCAGGFGFATTTRGGDSNSDDALNRMPEMDEFCESVEGAGGITQPVGSNKPSSWTLLP
jgi:hypothetical protein